LIDHNKDQFLLNAWMRGTIAVAKNDGL